MSSNSPRPQHDSSRAPKRQHRKVCSFCVEKINYIDYKEISRLRRFVSDRGKILPRRVTGTCARHQRPLTTALERARATARERPPCALTRRNPSRSASEPDRPAPRFGGDSAIALACPVGGEEP